MQSNSCRDDLCTAWSKTWNYWTEIQKERIFADSSSGLQDDVTMDDPSCQNGKNRIHVLMKCTTAGKRNQERLLNSSADCSITIIHLTNKLHSSITDWSRSLFLIIYLTTLSTCISSSSSSSELAVVFWGTMLQAGGLRVPFPMRSVDIFRLPNPSSRTMALRLCQPPTEMSTRNIPRQQRAADA
jgi:hypothetical protein